jgi:hypothetical protein
LQGRESVNKVTLLAAYFVLHSIQRRLVTLTQKT